MKKTPSAYEWSVQDALQPISDDVTRILVENHKDFRKFLSKRVGGESIAEDLLQQSLLKAIHHPPQAEERLSVLSWFYQILKNILIDHYRSQSSRDKNLEAFVRELEISGEKHVAAADELKADICKCMSGLLPTLKPEYAEVLKRVDLDEGAPEQVAKQMGLTLNNLNVRLHRARLALGKSLERTCGTCTEHGCLNCTCD